MTVCAKQDQEERLAKQTHIQFVRLELITFRIVFSIALAITLFAMPPLAVAGGFNLAAFLEGMAQQAEADRQRELQRNQLEAQQAQEQLRFQQQQELERQRLQLIRQQQELDRQKLQQQKEQEQQRLLLLQEQERSRIAEEKTRKEAEEAERTAISTGSGFFVTSDGYLVTNFHVIEDKTYLAVRDAKGIFHHTRVVAREPQKDLALLKVEGRFPSLKVGHSDSVAKGQRVLTVGYPQVLIQGNESKVTDGIINSLSAIKDNDDWFQISVPVQGGNSGGALVSESGTVFGVVVATQNAAKYFASTGTLPQNVNYAIKSRLLLDFLASARVKNIPSFTGKANITAVDSASVLIVARNVPIEVAYQLTPGERAAEAKTHQLGVSAEGESKSRRDALFVENRNVGDATNPTDMVKQYELGMKYSKGSDGTIKNESEAVRWYRKSAEQGYAKAQAWLASMLQLGRGVEKNEVEAARWMRMAADQLDPGAMHMMGNMYMTGRGVTKNEIEAVAWFRRAATKGSPDAQHSLGNAYSRGLGVEKDDSVALVWYRKALDAYRLAADKGNANSQYGLGAMFAYGRGTPKDEYEAVRWYRKAADQNHAVAQRSLGDAYSNGFGVSKDESEAANWYRKSADQGDTIAITKLANLSKSRNQE